MIPTSSDDDYRIISRKRVTSKRYNKKRQGAYLLLLAFLSSPLRCNCLVITNHNNKARCRYPRSVPCKTRLVDSAQESHNPKNDNKKNVNPMFTSDFPSAMAVISKKKNKLSSNAAMMMGKSKLSPSSKSKNIGSSVAIKALATSEIEAEDNERKRQWLRWMSSGAGGRQSGSSVVEEEPSKETMSEKITEKITEAVKNKKGVEDVKMREESVFGGVPRSQLYSAKDWWHNMITLPNSAILRDIRVPVTSITTWATMIAIAHRVLIKRNPTWASMICMPAAPHSMMVSALGLLLVFRTNSAYQKFVEGRKIWEEILNNARDMSRMTKLYEVEIGTEKRRRIQRLIAAFPYLLRHRIRPSLLMRRVNDPEYARDPEHSLLLYRDEAKLDLDYEAAAIATDEEETGIARRKTRQLYWVDKRTLPWRLLPSGAMEGCARAQNRPLWVCDRISKELATVQDYGTSFTNRERLALLSMVNKLSRTIGSCERIHQTVVPLNYARHALRSLTVWLFSLPFALVKDLGIFTGPVLLVISWMLFGVYEIGTKIEDPFQGTLRLSIICDAIRRDVLGDEIIRDTAFQLDETKADEGDVGFFENDDSEYDDDDNILPEKADIWSRIKW